MAEPTAGFSLNVLTINTHKGFTAFNRRFILPELRDAVRSVSADIVCLQEVMVSKAEIATRRERAAGKLYAAGAHYVVDTLADLPEVITDINARLAKGERP